MASAMSRMFLVAYKRGEEGRGGERGREGERGRGGEGEREGREEVDKGKGKRLWS